jgi:hypothetical protein
VDLSRVPPESETGPHFAMGATVRKSNRLVGQRMVADEVRFLGAKAKELLAAYGRERPRHSFRTFEDVEAFWEQSVRPVLKEFKSMQELLKGQEPVPQDSVWHANWRVPARG